MRVCPSWTMMVLFQKMPRIVRGKRVRSRRCFKKMNFLSIASTNNKRLQTLTDDLKMPKFKIKCQSLSYLWLFVWKRTTSLTDHRNIKSGHISHDCAHPCARLLQATIIHLCKATNGFSTLEKLAIFCVMIIFGACLRSMWSCWLLPLDEFDSTGRTPDKITWCKVKI